MGAMSRRKGIQFERELAKMFRWVFPGADVRRGLQSRDGGEVPDVECPLFWVEAKRGRKPSPRAALRQATDKAPKGRIPLAVIRDDRSEAFVVLNLADFLELARELWRALEK